MESCPERVTNRYSRSRTRNPEKWKRFVAKRLRYSSKSLPIRVCTHDINALRCSSLSMNQIQKLHENFYSRYNKRDQDALLLKYCSIVPAQQRKTYKGNKQTKYMKYV